MARYDGKLQAEREVDAADMRRLVVPIDGHDRSATERHQALVCLLSASEGWRDACRRTGGAFADEGGDETGLRGVKEG